MKPQNDILLVANLQVYATPYASLYVDMKRKTMLMFVRVSKPNDPETDYIVTDITQQQLEGYLHRKVGLKELYNPSSYQIARIEGGHVCIEPSHEELRPTREFEASNVFDPEYFYDDLRVLSFMKKMNENKIFA